MTDDRSTRDNERRPAPVKKPTFDDAIQTSPDLAVKVVRLREGVYASGAEVNPQVGSPVRVKHLMPRDADLNHLSGASACCDAWFAPGTLEVVPWGKLWPHTKCVQRSPWSRAKIERSFQHAEQQLPGLTDKEFDSGFSAVERILASRGDWTDPDEGFWEYTTSYNGVSAANNLRSRELGIESLLAEFSRTGMFRIWSCGVRNGCPKHASCTETYSLDEIRSIENRLTIHETIASSVDLQALAWCVVFGDCAQMEETDK